QIPKSSDRSEGWYSRWKFVEFPRQFQTSTDFKRKTLAAMETPEALSALLYWAVEGLRRLYKVEKFSASEQMESSEKQYRMDNDSVQAFISSCLIRVGHTGKETLLVMPSLYAVYKTWGEDAGV